MALKTSSANNQGLTPPDSPTKGMVTSKAIVKDLKHLFGVLLEKVLDLTNQEPPNTPVSQDQSHHAPTWRWFGRCWSVPQLNFQWQISLLSLRLQAINERRFLDQIGLISNIPSVQHQRTSNRLKSGPPHPNSRRSWKHWNSEEVRPYIDIKSEGLRDILRVVLHDVKVISLIEDKPSVIKTVLFLTITLTWI
ncbi:hypothetical protein N7539_008680 [Penicillium diatomitis]|uniref:Uncharacterized protein n=1 Tax=Penicillium diatomitis TaxID=2819901 RepID=A0A9W9WR09_9EURO|nr:uncharacterized protein N7539_008680 [Penicillium diatomitis]KAJ5472111.1 hypothetical protein N7539_008680 [Penicillium diatomitis]